MTRISNLYQPRRLLRPSSSHSGSNGLLSSNIKYKFKEERKRVLKLSVKKLKSVDDPEAFLSRSVLINNTLKRLQSEVRDEKLEKKKMSNGWSGASEASNGNTIMASYSPSPYSFCSIERAYREEMERLDNNTHSSTTTTTTNSYNGDSRAENSTSLSLLQNSTSINSTSSSSNDNENYPSVLSDINDCVVGNNDTIPMEQDDDPSSSSASSSSSSSCSSEEDDSDDQEINSELKNNNVEIENEMSTHYRQSVGGEEDDLLSEVYMPPPISSIDDHPDLPGVDLGRTQRPSTPVPWSTNVGQNVDDITDTINTKKLAEAVILNNLSGNTSGNGSCDINAEDIWSEAVRTECWTLPSSRTLTTGPTASPMTSLRTTTSTLNTPSWPSQHPDALSWPSYTPSAASTTSTASTTASTAASMSFNPNISVPTCTSHKENMFVRHLSDKTDKCYTCGQTASFFGQSELKSVVFNSLIASLET